MTNERYNGLMQDDSLSLTEYEIAQGWHFCAEFDCLLIGPGWPELEVCRCLPALHPVYKTIPPRGPDVLPIIDESNIGTIDP